MNGSLPAVRSILDAGALGRRVARDYNLGPFQDCRFFTLGLNDTYSLWAGDERFMLRLYRRGWRTAEDIAYEIDALLHLEARRVPVAGPVRRASGGFFGEVRTPEGPRPYVLFRHAPGQERFVTPEEIRRYGAAVAALHSATDDFRSGHHRFALDAEYLIEAPFRAVRPFFAHRPDDGAFLDGLIDRLRAGLSTLFDRQLDRGFCHGDVHGGNAHLHEAGSVWFFDFDCCGPGWRAYDVAGFRWRQEWRGMHAARNWAQFLDGYRSVRALSAADEDATWLFVAVREVWLIGVHVQTATDRGHGWNVLDEDYLDRRLRFLRAWSPEHG